jgi:hypothetical protein
MVSIDDRLHETLAATGAGTGAGNWWRRPRWLVLPVTLPVCLVFGLAVGTLINLALTGEGIGRQGAGLLATGSAVAAERPGLALPGVCERVEYIVSTACSLQQRDRDASEISRCIARERKYTLWSAYGCQ